MYHVVASDLDGTLLSPDHLLTPYAKETLKLLTAEGVHFVFATGRHHIDVGQIRDNLEIKAYMITSNGARGHDTHGNLVFSDDYAFSSPSAAAAVVCGRSANGRTSWVVEGTGQTYAAWQDQQLNSVTPEPEAE